MIGLLLEMCDDHLQAVVSVRKDATEGRWFRSARYRGVLEALPGGLPLALAGE